MGTTRVTGMDEGIWTINEKRTSVELRTSALRVTRLCKSSQLTRVVLEANTHTCKILK